MHVFNLNIFNPNTYPSLNYYTNPKIRVVWQLINLFSAKTKTWELDYWLKLREESYEIWKATVPYNACRDNRITGKVTLRNMKWGPHSNYYGPLHICKIKTYSSVSCLFNSCSCLVCFSKFKKVILPPFTPRKMKDNCHF